MPETIDTQAAGEARPKNVRLELPADTHRTLRVVAAKQNLPMAVFARRAVEQAIRNADRE